MSSYSSSENKYYAIISMSCLFLSCTKEKNNSYDCIINALNEVKILLNSGLHRSITGLDVIAHWLNEQYLPAHLREVFGHRSLSHEFLRELTELPKSKSPASLITTNNSRLSLDKILAGIKS